MIWCIYHKADIDGKCSAAIVRKFVESKNKSVTLLPADYNSLPDMSRIKKGETVFLVDFSLSIDKMKELNNKNKLIWIDHHKSAIKDADKAGLKVGGIQKEGKTSACELCWIYFFPGTDIPEIVELASQYDAWNNKDKEQWEKEVLPVQETLKSLSLDPEKNFDSWTEIFNRGSDKDFITKVVSEGKVILRSIRRRNSEAAEQYAFEAKIDGLRAICLNMMKSDASCLDTVYDPKKHDIKIVFSFDGKKYKVSLYSAKPNVDVSKVAKKFKGGGHKGASGFVCKSLPF